MTIFESKSTPSIIRRLLDNLIPKIDNIIYKKINDHIKVDIDEFDYIKERSRKVFLKCNLTINIIFNSNDYSGNINFEECINSDFKKCIINIKSPNNLIKKYIYKTILHELTHLYELYQIKDIYEKTSWSKSKKLLIFDKATENININQLYYFRDIYYISLPHEIRATISSVEIFLISLMTTDKNIMLDELKETTEYSRYRSLLDFNPHKLCNDLLSFYGPNMVIRVLNLFNKINNVNFELKKESDILKYLKNWNKYFKHVANDLIESFNRKIDEISKGNHIEYQNIDYLKESKFSNILPYEDYIKEEKRDIELYCLLYTDFNKFFK
jgi:hypothetical protein